MRLWHACRALYHRYCEWILSLPDDREYWDRQFRTKQEEEAFWKQQW